MWFKISSYFKFLLKSTNQHAVHSPFVYNLVTKCLYNKTLINKNYSFKERTKKETEIIQKLTNYLQQNASEKYLEKETYKLFFFENPNEKEFSNKLHLATNNSCFVFKNIYKNKKYNTYWKKMLTLNKVTVSIDTYFVGILFFRKEQAKQHFTIRV